MKIVSRKPATVLEPTPGCMVTNVSIDCDTNYMHPNGNRMVSYRNFYMDVTIRVPLSDEDVADGMKLNERMNNMRFAKIVEIK